MRKLRYLCAVAMTVPHLLFFGASSFLPSKSIYDTFLNHLDLPKTLACHLKLVMIHYMLGLVLRFLRCCIQAPHAVEYL